MEGWAEQERSGMNESSREELRETVAERRQKWRWMDKRGMTKTEKWRKAEKKEGSLKKKRGIS